MANLCATVEGSISRIPLAAATSTAPTAAVVSVAAVAAGVRRGRTRERAGWRARVMAVASEGWARSGGAEG